MWKDSKEKELEKVKKDSKRKETENQMKLSDMENELKRYQSELKKQVEENTWLDETNKTLAELQEVRDNLKKAQTTVKSKETCDDEEIVELPNRENDSSADNLPRVTSSAKFSCEVCSWETESAVRLKGHMTKHIDIKCLTCDLQCKTMGLFRRHMKTVHMINVDKETSRSTQESELPENFNLKCSLCDYVANSKIHVKNHMMSQHGGGNSIYCGMCDFKSQSKIQHMKHMKVAMGHIQHNKADEKGKLCSFFQKGICKFDQNTCRFAHPVVKPCRFQEKCWKWPNCPFSHDDQIPCKYQENCSRQNCTYIHFQPFLDINSFQDFPPLMQNAEVWRPW